MSEPQETGKEHLERRRWDGDLDALDYETQDFDGGESVVLHYEDHDGRECAVHGDFGEYASHNSWLVLFAEDGDTYTVTVNGVVRRDVPGDNYDHDHLGAAIGVRGVETDGGTASTGKHRCRRCGQRFDRPTEGGVPACPQGAVHVAERPRVLPDGGGQPPTGTDHYDGAGDGQCLAIKDTDGERCTNGVYGSNHLCGTHKNASDVTLAPHEDEREWQLCEHCGWQPAAYRGPVAACGCCGVRFAPEADRWEERDDVHISARGSGEPQKTAIERLGDPDVLCLEVYGRELVAIVWEDPERGPIANLRFGSGRHHTAVDPDLDKLVGRDSVEGVNVVSMDGAVEVDPE